MKEKKEVPFAVRKYLSELGKKSAKKRRKDMGEKAYIKMLSDIGKKGGWPKGRPRKAKE